MKAIILAAGRGSRMKGLTANTPKCLIELHGHPLLDWQIAALTAAGIDNIAIVTGYRRDALTSRSLQEFYNARWAETNMVASLERADAWLRAETCIISYSDIFYESTAISALMECDASLAVTYDPGWRILWEKRFGDPLLDAETFRLRSDGTLAEIGQRPTSVDDIEGQYMGLLRIAPDGWREIRRNRSNLSSEQRDKMHMTDTLQMVIEAKRMQIAAVPYTDEWGEIDSPNDLAAY